MIKLKKPINARANEISIYSVGTVSLYKSMVRSHLEYANAVRNPHREGLIKDLERVQMRTTKLVSGLKKQCYEERLKVETDINSDENQRTLLEISCKEMPI